MINRGTPIPYTPIPLYPIPLYPFRQFYTNIAQLKKKITFAALSEKLIGIFALRMLVKFFYDTTNNNLFTISFHHILISITKRI